MKVFVTGASGFVGQHLVKELILQNIQVVCAGRKAPNHNVGEFYLVTDFNDAIAWQEPLVGCDVVIHLAARVHVMKEVSQNPLDEFRKVNVAGTILLARSAALAGVKRFVYISSIKVNGEETINGQSFNEKDCASPQDTYGISKLEAEQALQRVAEETGLEVVIVRPPLVYGAGVKANFAKMLTAVARGIPLPLASVANKRSLIYVENLVDAIILCATHPNAAGNTYLVSDGEDVSTSDLLSKLAFAMGKKPRLFSFPIRLLKLAGKLVGMSGEVNRLVGSLQLDISKIRYQLGWVPPFTLEDGLKATVKGISKSF